MTDITKEQKQNIKEYIKNEHKKCVQSAKYFIKNYCMIQTLKSGRKLFDLYPYQEQALVNFEEHDYNITVKARQIGYTSCVAAYSLWKMLFNKDIKILVLATTQETAKQAVGKVSFMYDNLPGWLKIPTLSKNKLSIQFENKSEILAMSSSPEAARSHTANILIIDEAAFIENFENIWSSAFGTTAEGGKVIIISTPNGVGNEYHKLWVAAINNEEISNVKFFPTKLDWRSHPNRDNAWYTKTLAVQGKDKFDQEFETKFLSSGNIVFSADAIEWYEANFMIEPSYKTGIDDSIWIWKAPDYSRSYLMCVDVSRGDGTDFSAFHIIDAETCEQICEYRGKIDTRQFGHLIIKMATEYNDALTIIDNSNIGWDVIQTLIDRQYKNLFYMTEDLKYINAEQQYSGAYNRNEKRAKPGFTISSRTRPLMIAKIEEYIRDHSIIIHSKRSIEEWKVFIWHNAKAQAASGYNDDLILSLAMGLWCRDTALLLNKNSQELTKSALDGFTQTTYEEKILMPKHLNEDPYILNFGRNTIKGNSTREDLRWLL